MIMISSRYLVFEIFLLSNKIWVATTFLQDQRSRIFSVWGDSKNVVKISEFLGSGYLKYTKVWVK